MNKLNKANLNDYLQHKNMVSQWKTPRVLQMQLVSKTSEFVHSGQV
jgi:hypothetical protein